MINIILTTFYGVAVVAMIFFIVFFAKQPEKSAPVRSFLILASMGLAWVVLEIIAPLDLFGEEVSLLLWRLSFFASAVVTFLVLWAVLAVIFKKLNYWLLAAAVPAYAYLFYLTVLTAGVIKNALPGRNIWETGYVTGDKFLIIIGVIALPLFLAIIFTLYKFLVSPRGEYKSQLGYILVGLFFPTTVGLLTNLLLPLLDTRTPRIANLSGVAMIFFIYYSIHKYGAYGGVTRRYSIKTRLTFSFIIVAFVAGMAGASVFYQVINDFLKTQLSSQLRATAKERSVRIEHFLNDQRQKIEYLTTNNEISEELDSRATSSEGLSSRYLNNNISRNENLFENFYEVFILNKEGTVVDSTDHDILGRDHSQYDHFLEGRLETYVKDVHNSRITNERTLTISSPIKKTGSEDLLGVVVGLINTRELSGITRDRTGLGDTGEVYLVNKSGYMITSSRFKENVFLKEKVNTSNTKQCFTERDGPKDVESPDHFFGIFQDYRGEEVLGTYSYIPAMNWCLLAEVDTSEYLGFYKDELRDYYLWAFVVLFLVAGGFGYVFSYTISRPLLGLKREVERASEKDFKHRIESYSRDEIGKLAQAFNDLIKRIKGSRKEMNERIEEQTKEIEKKKQELEDQQRAILNVLEDVSEEKDKAAEQKDKMEAILYSIGDGVFVIDKDYKITMFNNMAAEISGYSAKEAIGKKFDEVLKFVDEKEEKNKHGFINKPMETGEIQEMGKDTVLITKDGQRIPVADSAAPLKDKDGKIRGCVVVFRDVTKERQIDKAKTEFVSLASHQLRTPLSSINWYAEMLLDGDAGDITDEQKEFLKEIYKGNQRMVNLVNALLNVSRIELGKLSVEPEPIDFKGMAQSVLKELRPVIEEKKLKVSTDCSKNLPKIKADPKLVRIIFQNLLSNAVKYTPEEGGVGLKIKKLKEHLKIEVSDSGYGIPKDQHDKIFTKMFRADNVKEKDAEGTGLGLYIVKSIIGQAGGEIWFKSQKNKGTTFHIKFPLKGMSKREGSRTLNEIK